MCTRGFLPLLALLFMLAACGERPLSVGDHRLAVEGGSIFYRVTGTGGGIPIVLLHGGPGSTSHYLQPLSALGTDRPVVLYDQLGSGRSDRITDTTHFQIARYVRELDALRRALRLERLHLYGHSWGSMLALEYLATDPDGIVSVTLASPIISMESWAADGRALVRTMPDSIQRIIARHEAAGTTSSPEYQEASFAFMVRYVFGMEPPFPPEVDSTIGGFNLALYEIMWGPSEFSPHGNLRGFDRSAVLKSLRMPVLFTAGRHDEARPETVERFARDVPNARVRIFEKSAHLAMVTEPEAYVDTVRAFLRDSER